MKRILITALIIGLFSLFLAVDSAKATMIIEKSFNQVAQEAELIFEGKVLSTETRLHPINDKPFTYFTFEIIDVLKGEYAEHTIELGFMGGPKGDSVLKVSDMRMPEVGEQGFYFVKTLGEQYIHPLSGWHQGHYLVIESEQTNMGVVVPVMQNEAQISPYSTVQSLSVELTVEDFKKNIRKAIEGEQ